MTIDPAQLNKSQKFVQILAELQHPGGVKADTLIDRYRLDDRTLRRYLADLREITDKHEVVFILDEVITGFRMAPGGAQERYAVTPDLSTHAKILAVTAGD